VLRIRRRRVDSRRPLGEPLARDQGEVRQWLRSRRCGTWQTRRFELRLVRMARAEWLATLDPGIAPYVDVLDANGVETFESCEGGDGHCFAEPTVRFFGGRGEGFRALAVALQIGPLPVKAIRRYWRVGSDGAPEGPNWEMTFLRPAESL
jgi:hypothetical protein